MNLFSTGLEALQKVQEEQQRRKQAENSRKYLRMWFADGESKLLRFLLPEPIVYHAHTFDRGRVEYVCTDHKHGCPICKAKHLKSYPGQVGKLPVRWVDADEYDGKPQDDRLFIWEMTFPALKAFAVTASKLKNRNMTGAIYDVVRTGTGSATAYQFFAEDPSPFTDLDNKLLPEIPDWNEIIKAPTDEEIKALLTGNVPFSIVPEKKGGSGKSSGGVPAPSVDRRQMAQERQKTQEQHNAEVSAAMVGYTPAQQAPTTDAATDDTETPPWPDDEAPIRTAADFV